MRKRHYDQLAAALSLVLLASLAGVSYYLAQLAERFPRDGGGRKLTHEPDYFVERFLITKMDRQGEPSFRMSADRMVHYPDDDTSEFTRPVLVSLDPARPRVTISATRGSATSKGEQTDLHGQVELLRAGGEGKPPLRVSTDHVRILPEQDLALTERPVRIESGDSVLTGVGMRFNNADRTLDVLSRVQSRWVGRAARPDTAAR